MQTMLQCSAHSSSSRKPSCPLACCKLLTATLTPTIFMKFHWAFQLGASSARGNEFFFAILIIYLSISRKRYKIRIYLLWKTNMKWYRRFLAQRFYVKLFPVFSFYTHLTRKVIRLLKIELSAHWPIFCVHKGSKFHLSSGNNAIFRCTKALRR